MTGDGTTPGGAYVPTTDLLRWAEALAGVARTGLAFTASGFETERFEEVLHIASDILAAGTDERSRRERSDLWSLPVDRGIAGYVTPKVAVGALVANDDGELLLIQRTDSGAWLYPTGWADVGYSATEVVVKEVAEETGIVAEPIRLAMVLDGLRLGASAVPLYSLVFFCRVLGGELKLHPLECMDGGFFPQERMPEPLIGSDHWVSHAFAHARGETTEVLFDRPRKPPWRSPN